MPTTRARVIPRTRTAAGAGYANRNQSQAHPAGAAAGAGYANNNQSLNHPGAAGAAAGAGYANRNQGLAYPGAAGAAAGAGYANNHSGINGAWNGNNYGAWGATGYGGGVGAWGTGSPMYSWGYSGYSNPYAAGYSGSGGVAQPVAAQQPGGARLSESAATAYNYSQPISTTAHRAEQAVAGQANAAFDQAAMRSSRAIMVRPYSSTSRHSRKRPMTGPCTSSSAWCSLLRANTTRPLSRSTPSSRSHPAGTGRP